MDWSLQELFFCVSFQRYDVSSIISLRGNLGCSSIVPYFLAIAFSNNDWWAFSMQYNFNSFACASLSLLLLQVVMKRLFNLFKNNFFCFQICFNVNCLFMLYSVYHCSWFLKVVFGIKYCSGSLIAILVQDMSFWPAEAGRHLNFWRCIQVLHLVLKRCSDISEGLCIRFSYVHCFGDHSCITDWTNVFPSVGNVWGWSSLVFRFYGNGKFCNWFPKLTWPRMDSIGVFLLE